MSYHDRLTDYSNGYYEGYHDAKADIISCVEAIDKELDKIIARAELIQDIDNIELRIRARELKRDLKRFLEWENI